MCYQHHLQKPLHYIGLANETLSMQIFLCAPPAAPLVKVHDPLKDKISK
jgi:hypothetical protein